MLDNVFARGERPSRGDLLSALDVDTTSIQASRFNYTVHGSTVLFGTHAYFCNRTQVCACVGLGRPGLRN